MKKFIYLSGALIIALASCKKKEADPANACIASDLDSVLTGQVIQFTNCSDGDLTREWEFGDGGNSTVENPSHKFEEAGEYNVTLTVTNVEGETSLVTKTIAVNDVKLKAVDVKNSTLADDIFEYYFNGNVVKNYNLEWLIYGITYYEYLNNFQGTEFGTLESLTLDNPVVITEGGAEFSVLKSEFTATGIDADNATFKIDPYNDLDLTATNLKIEKKDSGQGTTCTFYFELSR